MLIKSRMYYIGLVIIVIALGLGSRAYADSLPSFVAAHAGDVLWGSMIYFGFRVLLTGKKLKWAVLFSLLFCLGIELSQLYQAEWINQVRSTVLGGLILGKGFLMIDLLRYCAGILSVFILDSYRYIYKRVN